MIKEEQVTNYLLGLSKRAGAANTHSELDTLWGQAQAVRDLHLATTTHVNFVRSRIQSRRTELERQAQDILNGILVEGQIGTKAPDERSKLTAKAVKS
jgi:hypothetical protein